MAQAAQQNGGSPADEVAAALSAAGSAPRAGGGRIRFTDKDEHMYFWFPLLAGLSELTFDPRPEIRCVRCHPHGWLPGSAGSPLLESSSTERVVSGGFGPASPSVGRWRCCPSPMSARSVLHPCFPAQVLCPGGAV